MGHVPAIVMYLCMSAYLPYSGVQHDGRNATRRAGCLWQPRLVNILLLLFSVVIIVQLFEVLYSAYYANVRLINYPLTHPKTGESSKYEGPTMGEGGVVAKVSAVVARLLSSAVCSSMVSGAPRLPEAFPSWPLLSLSYCSFFCGCAVASSEKNNSYTLWAYSLVCATAFLWPSAHKFAANILTDSAYFELCVASRRSQNLAE